MAATELAVPHTYRLFYFPLWRFDPMTGYGLPLWGFTITHWTHHTWQDPSERMISPTQKPLPDSTQ